MKVRRTKPYVCVDCDFAEHHRFQATGDVDAAAGTWLRCLAYSRAQEQDGVVKSAWLRRTFAATYGRVEELVEVGLLRLRDDGDYELHAYAPRNQTRAMITKERAATRKRVREWRQSTAKEAPNDGPPVTPYTRVTGRVGNAAVPTSISTSTSSSLASALPYSSFSPPSFSSSARSLEDISTGDVKAVPPADAPALAPEREQRRELPRSERALSGPFWADAFRAGIREETGRPCTLARYHLETLERIVTHHAPHRDAPRATTWLKAEAKAFAAQWDGEHPAKGISPDGLERWLNDGRPAPPVFGRPRLVQPAAEAWHEDDWSDLGAEVSE